jgi:DNA-directed RNA polymerase beta' subunit
MPKLLDINEFCKDLKEVTTQKITMKKKKFDPDGLFSEQIFGPLKNYTCQCGTYYGISKSGGTCKVCGVDIVSADERRKRFAKIVLPVPVINPLFLDLIMSISKVQLKEMIDTLLTDEEKVIACKLAKEAGADFVKTSTGLFGKGATVEDVRLMRQTVGKEMGVKAAGSVRTYTDVVAMIEAGANRIGTSTAVQIIEGAP